MKYVQQLQQNRLLSDRKENTGAQSPTQTQIINDFVAGFAECAKQVEEFVCQTSPIDPIVVTSLSGHLNNIIGQLEAHDTIPYIPGVIRHTGSCCPPSPAPSTVSSASGGIPHPMLDMDVSSISSADEDMPLNLSSNSNRFADHFPHQMIAGEDRDMWRPW